MEGKRIRFSDPTPNDQGMVVPNDSIEFTRFHLNPVLLCQHDWNAPPLGTLVDLKLDADGWTGIPVFHRKTKVSVEYADMWEAGALIACSIGGDADFEYNAAGQPVLSKEGSLITKKFYLYEVSMVTLPSNMKAVQLGAHVFKKDELDRINSSIVTLSSKYKTLPHMEITKTVEQELAEARARVVALEAQAAKPVKLANNDDPSFGQLPEILRNISNANAEVLKSNTALFNGFLDKIFSLFGAITKKPKLAAPTPGKPTEESVISDGTQEQPTPTGLEAQQAAAKLKADTAQALAAKAALSASAAKLKADLPTANQADKEAYAAAMLTAQTAFTAYLEASEELKACMESEDEDATEMGSGVTRVAAQAGKPAAKPAIKPAAQAATTAANGTTTKVTMKTPEELANEGVTLAAKPEIRVKMQAANGLKFSSLMDKTHKRYEEGQRILGRVTDHNEEADVSDYAIILESIMTDKKFSAIVEKTRVIANISEAQFSGFARSGDLNERPGLSLKHFAAQLQAGCVDAMGADHQMRRLSATTRREMIKLTSTDNALAAPALNTIEWLSLAIFTLFPTTDWKNDIPMFGAQMTGANTGIIWANITANPAITFGNQPVNPADYTYGDDGVALTLIPSWLQPMLWTPLTMHQLRYDQMATGWAQAFALWGSLIDDKLIYTLASTVPASSIIKTVGQKNPNGPGSSFTLTGADDPNAFYYNSALQTTLATPAYSDIIRTEQLYNKQNFQITREKPRLVIDPTMEAFLCLDPFTQSLLTRWIEANREDLIKLKHTSLNQRSRVAIFDPASGQVKDPGGVIPVTAVSAALGFLASQVALGLGILDVFMIQDPSSYGYRMSADIREGIVPVRKNYNGTLLYTYGAPAVA